MTTLQKKILAAVQISKTRPVKSHPKYLPEVLALVNQGVLKLVESGPDVLIVDLP
jgi:hypothetical protein